jgi:hypothetical protein
MGDVVALISVLCTAQESLKAKRTPGKAVAHMEKQITEISRIRNVLDKHVKDLYADEMGTAAYNIIGGHVIEAINQGEQMARRVNNHRSTVATK